MTKKQPTTLTRVLALGLLLAPSLSQAHPGHSTGLSEGLAHPFTGLDHFVAMVGVGLWAAQLGGRARFLVPMAFVAFMAAGGALGMAGLAAPGVEQSIAASLLLVGLMLVVQFRLSTGVAMSLAAVFAVFHGLSHGTQMPSATNPAIYALGFMVSTVALHLCGVGLALLPSQMNRPMWSRLAGAAVVACGAINFSLRL